MRRSSGVIDPMDGRLELVADDLVARFDECSPSRARALVKSVAAQFDGAPVQDFVALLTGKICRDVLFRPSLTHGGLALRSQHQATHVRSLDDPLVRLAVRRFVAFGAVAHGGVHLLGAAKGLGWAAGAYWSEPITAPLGALWLAAAIVTVLTGVLLLTRVRWWWVVGAISVVVSQALIVTSWGDAWAGTLPNVVLSMAVIWRRAMFAPGSR